MTNVLTGAERFFAQWRQSNAEGNLYGPDDLVSYVGLETVPGNGRQGSSLASYLLNNAVYNVKDFGAKGDGVTDDTTAIQNAINAAAVNGAGTQGAPLTFAAGRLYFPRGLYRVSGSLVIPTCIGFSWVGEGAPSGQTMSAMQWIGTDQASAYMVDARSVLGFRLHDFLFIGQSDVATNSGVNNSACCGNGIWSRRYASGLFNSYNDWRNVSFYRFSGIGIKLGDYAGWNGSSYPADLGQVDNSVFTNITCADCRIGIVTNTPNLLGSVFIRPFVFNYGGNPVDGSNNPIESVGNAAPIKFRTKNAVQVLYGQFHAVGPHLYATYADTDAWSQYAIYCQDGSYTFHGGYSEARYFVYTGNGANNAGSANWNNTNAIRDVCLQPGAAGGPVTAGKHQVNHNQTLLPLRVSGFGWTDILEASNSAGVFVEGQERIVSLSNGNRVISPTEHGTTYLCDATSGAVFLTLPGPSSTVIGQRYTAYNKAGANNVVWSPQATDTIDGAGSSSFGVGHARTIMLVSTGKWVTVSSF